MASSNSSKKRTNSKSKSNASGSKTSRRGANNLPKDPVLSPGMRDDLIGVALAVIGVVLFVAVIAPGNAVVSRGIEMVLRHVLGIGAFMVPFAFVIWGISYFVKTEESRIGRFIIGVVLMLVAVMGIFSLFQPTVDVADANTLFDSDTLIYGGGYVGSGLAWPLLFGFGRLIACIILVGIIIAGLVLIGLSIGSIFVFIKNFFGQERQPKSKKRKDEDFQAEVKKGRQQSFDDYDTQDIPVDGDNTIMLGNKRLKQAKQSNDQAFVNPDDFNLVDSSAETQVFEDFTFGDDDIDSSKETVVLGVEKKKPTKRRGSTTTRKSSKKAEGEDNASAKTVKLDAPSDKVEKPTASAGFALPETGLIRVSGTRSKNITGELKETAAHLQRTLEEFNLPAKIVGWLAGPTVTMYKVDLPSGVKLSRLTGLADDIALSLAASAVRIAQIPGTSLVGVEIPNKTRATVLLGDILPSAKGGPLDMAIGEDVDGNKICVDLAKMPHLLIGGTTGSGKSVCINAMIMSVLMRSTPAEVRMILIDPKRVEFSGYNGIPHLYVPVVTEPKEAAAALRWGVVEMERRLKIFEKAGARNIGAYNKKVQDGELANEAGEGPSEMPFIMIVIDELSDLMMAAGKEVEDSIVRISQLARAAGIHLIVATQRPSSNVVTGMIKANITNRIALSVATGVDSRVILDTSGAEKLVGNGDMLFAKPDWGKPKRIQGCYVSDPEIAEVVEHLKEQGSPEYHLEILQQVGGGSASGGSEGGEASDDDPLIWDAADAVVHAGMGSTSMLQRRLKVGYARAGRIMDMLEAKGIVGPQDGSRAREVLIDSVEDLEAIKAFEAADREGF